jgi:hypothetical protein
MKNRSSLLRHLEHVSKDVDSWPNWKKNALGNNQKNTTSNTTTQTQNAQNQRTTQLK